MAVRNFSAARLKNVPGGFGPNSNGGGHGRLRDALRSAQLAVILVGMGGPAMGGAAGGPMGPATACDAGPPWRSSQGRVGRGAALAMTRGLPPRGPALASRES